MKVYYNGSCNICNAEINQYKKIEKKIDYIDVSKFTDSNIEHLSKKNLFRRMHVYENGKLFAGSESFLVLWEKMPKLKYLAMFLKLPILRQLWKIVYEFAATLLYLKNKSKI